MSWAVRPGSQEEQVGRLILAGVIVVFLPQLPLGNFLIYPFTILTTWFHEMGHGLTAILMGHEFELLKIYPDGSGVAQSYHEGPESPIASAFISAGGPLGPTMIGSILILASSKQQYWRPTLIVLAACIGLSTVIWVRSTTGVIVLPMIAVALTAAAWKGKDWLVRFALQFLGILAAMSMFRDWDYLFSESAVIDGQIMLSDTGAIANALLLPYWFWAMAIILLSGLMVGASLKYALAEDDDLNDWRR